MVLAGLLGLIAALYLPTLGYGFVYDDGWTLRSNGFLRDFDLSVLFSDMALARHVPDAFRPTLVIFDAAAYALLGLNSACHHALSVLLHLGVCALIFRLLRGVGAPLLDRASVMVLFGVMAIHAEAVAVVSFREDLLAAILGLAALGLAQRSLYLSPKQSAVRRGLLTLLLGIGACALMALACGAKMSAAPLPVFWLLLESKSPWRSISAKARARGPLYFAVAALLLGVGLAVAHGYLLHGGLSPYDPGQNPRIFATRVGTHAVLAASTQIHVGYVQQLMLPLGLSPEYVDFAAAWTDPATLACALVLLALLVVGLAHLRRGKSPTAALTILGAILLAIPTSNLIGMPNMRADRFMYLPSLPICIGVAAGCLALGRKAAHAMPSGSSSSTANEPDLFLLVLPTLLFVVVQGSVCLAASTTYASNTNLWATALRRSPDSARAHALVGIQRLAGARDRARHDPALLAVVREHCAQASELDPIYELPEICHARLALVEKNWSAAYLHYQRALRFSIDRNDRILGALAQISLDLPDMNEPARLALSRRHLDKALDAYPYSPELHAVAATLAHRAGYADRAMALYRRARFLRPDRWETVVGGLELALDLGDTSAAYRTWLEDHRVLDRAHPAIRAALRRRLIAARNAHRFTLLQSLCRPGVFPNEP